MVNNNGVETLYYGYTDNQGSLIALTDASGNVVEKYAYDPWGARRNPRNWTCKDNRTSWIVNRGYTMHEHIDAFGIINMNGRVYDPATAMFMNTDPLLQSPDNWVNYNRYSYCFNNPMIYTDPSGYLNEESTRFEGCEKQFWEYLAEGNSYARAAFLASGGGGGGGGGSTVGHYEDVSSTTLVQYSYTIDPITGEHKNTYFDYESNVTRQWVWNSNEDRMYAAVHPETEANITQRNAYNVKYKLYLSVTYYADTKITHDLKNLKTITSDMEGHDLSVSYGPYSQGNDGSIMIGNFGFNPTNGDFILNQSLTNPFSNTTYGVEIHFNANDSFRNLIMELEKHPEKIMERVMETME